MEATAVSNHVTQINSVLSGVKRGRGRVHGGSTNCNKVANLCHSFGLDLQQRGEARGKHEGYIFTWSSRTEGRQKGELHLRRQQHFVQKARSSCLQSKVFYFFAPKDF